MPTSEFKKVSSLGKGSYGSVYKVQRKSDKKIYALKEVSIKTLKHEERQQAVNEIRILASLHHKSIIRYREAFLEKDNLYIVTEYARGGDLHRKIKAALQGNTSIGEKTVWNYFIQIARGVQVLHENGILHRDLKPKNIFLTASNNVKIGDLGCSKILEKAKLTQTQVGTPYYMSPEIWRRKPYDTKSDIWAIGCILFELVALGPPFLADNIEQLSSKVCTTPLPKHKIRLGYSPDLIRMICWLMQKQPRDRPDCTQILSSSPIKLWTDRLVQAGRNVQVTPAADRKGAFERIDTIKVPRQKMHAGNVHLPAKMYQPNFDGSVAPGAQVQPCASLADETNTCSLPQVAASRGSLGAVAGKGGKLYGAGAGGKENLSKYPSKAYQPYVGGGGGRVKGSVQPKYSAAAHLPMYTQAQGGKHTHATKQYGGVGAAGRPRQPQRPGGYQNRMMYR